MPFVNVLAPVHLARGLREHGFQMLEEARLVAALLQPAEVDAAAQEAFLCAAVLDQCRKKCLCAIKWSNLYVITSGRVAAEDQAETDRLWQAIVGNGGQARACGWCKDQWGLSWQITPRALTEALADPDRAAAKRAFDAMMGMVRIDIAGIERVRRGL
ncbi:VOC family protein [Chromobacterium sp. S0633]|uniref:VOC family protein n=1 Tax=Chromobacterium sp. S0633 TaxID=2957805 RepID=UPI0020A02DFF|nr:VOC family protein [Chromobacterium sp. S0633]MCP1290566.1 VOC family protein [Chromobacterium sp. S0633]